MPRIGLLVTCLVDLFRPSVGFAAVRLLEQAGYAVEVPAQGCCGQPNYNSGDQDGAKALARAMIVTLEPYDYVVAPSGSCAGMMARHYPSLFADDPAWRHRAQAIADRTHELVSFLTDVVGIQSVTAQYNGRVAYHDSCSGLRELGIHDQPRRLLSSMPGLELAELDNPQTCCGFGGAFCVKYPDISTRMADDKAQAVIASQADMLVAGDMGCLLNIAGRLQRLGSTVTVRHVAELLAGPPTSPGIGQHTP